MEKVRMCEENSFLCRCHISGSSGHSEGEVPDGVVREIERLCDPLALLSPMASEKRHAHSSEFI